MSFSTVHAPIRAGSQFGPGQLFGRVVHAVWLMLARSRERDMLAGMDARELRDIGVTPYEAGLEARKPFWRA
jgi:uncharacterized protein YjiS (DUF1127 family)